MKPLDAAVIFADHDGPVHVGAHGEVLQQTASTMDVARERLLASAEDGYVVLAEHQSAGRGRRGAWESPPGLGLLMSIVLNVGLRAAEQRLIAVMGAVAVAEALKRLGVAARIKWPNDVVVRPPGGSFRVRKLGGMLVQRVPRPDSSAAHILGVGINVNHDTADLPADAAVPATSMRIERGQEFDRNTVARAVLRELDAWYRILAMGQHERILARWRTHSCLLGERVRAMVEGRPIEGDVIGLSSTGELILRDTAGQEFRLVEERTKLEF